MILLTIAETTSALITAILMAYFSNVKSKSKKRHPVTAKPEKASVRIKAEARKEPETEGLAEKLNEILAKIKKSSINYELKQQITSGTNELDPNVSAKLFMQSMQYDGLLDQLSDTISHLREQETDEANQAAESLEKCLMASNEPTFTKAALKKSILDAFKAIEDSNNDMFLDTICQKSTAIIAQLNNIFRIGSNLPVVFNEKIPKHLKPVGDKYDLSEVLTLAEHFKETKFKIGEIYTINSEELIVFLDGVDEKCVSIQEQIVNLDNSLEKESANKHLASVREESRKLRFHAQATPKDILLKSMDAALEEGKVSIDNFKAKITSIIEKIQESKKANFAIILPNLQQILSQKDKSEQLTQSDQDFKKLIEHCRSNPDSEEDKVIRKYHIEFAIEQEILRKPIDWLRTILVGMEEKLKTNVIKSLEFEGNTSVASDSSSSSDSSDSSDSSNSSSDTGYADVAFNVLNEQLRVIENTNESDIQELIHRLRIFNQCCDSLGLNFKNSYKIFDLFTKKTSPKINEILVNHNLLLSEKDRQFLETLKCDRSTPAPSPSSPLSPILTTSQSNTPLLEEDYKPSTPLEFGSDKEIQTSVVLVATSSESLRPPFTNITGELNSNIQNTPSSSISRKDQEDTENSTKYVTSENKTKKTVNTEARNRILGNLNRGGFARFAR